MSAAVAPAAPDAGAQSAAALKTRFGPAVTRVWQSCGDTIAHVTRDKAHEAMAWLKNDPGQRFNYLVDITAVEYRDPERALEVVYNLRSIDRKAELRLKIELDKAAPLEVDSVYDLWRGADWLEREVFDMFGVSFKGHPDLRRILMWETYAEGFPLRKDFPLRGHFSRAEQTRQALAANPEAHYSLAELSIVDAYGELPADVRDRLDHGKRGTVE